MSIPTLKGIASKYITTYRISTRVLFSGKADSVPVLFLHGNWSCATWWEETMLALPDGFWGIAFDQRGYGESDVVQKVIASRGARDWADDAISLLNQINVQKAHFVGCSMGGYTVWRLMVDYPERILSVIQVNPCSPYGFSGTKDIHGTPCFDDYAGTGGGIRNQELIKRVLEKDRSLESDFSPRASMRTLFIPPFIPTREEELLSSILATHLGDQDVPGDFSASPNWPYVAPGRYGAYNAASPKYAGDVSLIYDGRIKAPVLWIRGRQDTVISDTSEIDTGYLGMLGTIPDWPGMDVYPPQPMVSQTRTVLDAYTAAGGSYREMTIENAAHIPFLEQPEAFNELLHEHFLGNYDFGTR
jgi:pimeloyl-ACP methyl ester carboxylesterase